MDFSDKTGVSASMVNEALYQCISAGVDTADAMGVLEVANKAAAGGFSTLDTSINGLTTVLNSYGLESSEADKIANQMLITQNKGKTTFDELAQSIGRVAPTASALGLETKELFSSLAVVTANGLQTTEAVTGLKAAFANIVKPSSDALKLADSLGISFEVSAIKSMGWNNYLMDMRSKLMTAAPELEKLEKKFGDIHYRMHELEKAGKKNTKEYKDLKKQFKGTKNEIELLASASDSQVGAMATMFGSVEALNAILMLTSEQGMNLYNETINEMETNTGALDDAFKKMDDTPAQKMAKAINKIKNVMIELGAVFLPVVASVVESVGNWISKFRDLDEGTKNVVIGIGVFLALIGPIISMVTGAVSIFNTMSFAFGTISTMAAAAGISIGALVLPITLVIGAIGLLVVAVATNFGGIRDTLSSICSEIGSIFTTAWNNWKSVWDSNFLGIQTFTTTVFNNIKNIFKTVFDGIRDIFTIFSKLLQGDWQGCWEAVKNFAVNLWNNVKNMWKQALDGFVDFVLNFGFSLYTSAVDAWENFKKAAKEKWDQFTAWFGEAIKDPEKFIKNIGSSLFNAGCDIIKNIWDGAKNMWNSVQSWFDSKVNWIKDKLTFWKKSKGEMSEDSRSIKQIQDYNLNSNVITANPILSNPNSFTRNNTNNNAYNFYGNIGQGTRGEVTADKLAHQIEKERRRRQRAVGGGLAYV